MQSMEGTGFRVWGLGPSDSKLIVGYNLLGFSSILEINEECDVVCFVASFEIARSEISRTARSGICAYESKFCGSMRNQMWDLGSSRRVCET